MVTRKNAKDLTAAEKTAFVDGYPQQSGSDLIFKIDNTGAQLEANLDQKDLIVITGKLQSS